MPKQLFLFFTLVILSYCTNAQNPQWLNYTNGDRISSIAEEADHVWVGTIAGGLVKIHKSTGDAIFYNKLNSGLPYSSVLTITIDGNGTKWIGTLGGLLAFDGSDWILYDTTNSGLPHSYVHSIAIDGNGAKWIGTRDGLAFFDDNNWTVYNTSNSGLPHKHVQSIVIDNNGTKWIGTGGGGLAAFDGINWTVYNTSNSGLQSNYITTICIDDSGAKWIGASNGALTVFDGTYWTVLPIGNVEAIAIDSSGTKWIGTSGGLATFDGSNWTTYNTSNSGLPNNRVYSIVIDGSGIKWIGTHDGLVIFDDTNWTTINTSNSGLPHRVVWSIAIDGSGTKWIGTYGGGLAAFDGYNWTTYNTSNSGLPNNLVLKVAVEGSGAKWIGTTHNGLAVFDGDSWIVYNTSNSGLPHNVVESFAFDDDGTKWIGTGGGLAAFDGTNWTIYNSSNSGLPHNGVPSIAIDDSGTKWIGTGGGLAVFDGANWTIFNTSNSDLPHNFVSAIVIDENSTKWIGTGGGLSAFDGTNWTIYDTSNSGLPHNSVISIAIDSSGAKWIGTYGGGLAAFDGTNWTTYNTSNSVLSFDYVQTVAIDNHGTKWVGSGALIAFNENGIPVSCPAFELPFEEGFNGLSTGDIPDCWSRTHMNWFATQTSNAGGNSPEMTFYSDPGEVGVVLLISPLINTTGHASLTLQFKHALNHNFDALDDYALGVKTSSDGVTWNTVWSINPNDDISPETLQIEIDNTDVGSATFRFAFFFDGDSFDIDNWWIDDIILDETQPQTPEHLPVTGILTGDQCYDATASITITDAVIGNGIHADFRSGGSITATNFNLQPDGTAFMTAATSITFQPDVSIMPEITGYFLAKIGEFEPCSLPSTFLTSENMFEPEQVPQKQLQESFFRVYPNPTTSTLKLELLDADEVSSINVEIYSMMGERIFQDILLGARQYEFDLSSMPKGIYFIRVLKGNENGIEKVIKQ
jgi:ligand-binding sensor domain-containing protein